MCTEIGVVTGILSAKVIGAEGQAVLRRQARMQRKEDRRCDAVVSLRRSNAAMRRDRPSESCALVGIGG